MTNHIDIRSLSVSYPFRDVARESIRGRLAGLLPGRRGRAERREAVDALSELSLSIREGERVGLVGTNGSGKTTLLKVLARVLHPTSGSIEVSGHVNAIFDPSLGMDPEASGYENILIRCMLLRVPPAVIDEKVAQIADFSELGEALRRPIKTYSAGMAMRLAFSIATSIEPEILVMDEWLSAGDARFVSKALKKMESLIVASRILVIASHSEHVLTQWCNRLLWMKDGKLVEDGAPEKVLEAYRQHTCAA